MSWWKNKKNLVIGFSALIFLALGFFAVAPALAQVNTGIEFGRYTGLVDTDIRIIVAKIIRAVLGLLGIVVLGYTLYGGYLYLTAGGNPDQVKDAKAVLKNAIIGLVIILSAFSITQFIISRLTESIIGNYCAQNPAECVDCVTNPAAPQCLPPGCTDPAQCPLPGSAFYSSVSPQGQLPIYNVVINVQFSGGFGSVFVNRNTVVYSDTVKIVKSLGGGSFETTAYPATLEFINDSLVAVHPTGSCGDGITTNDCFEKNTTYKVILSNSIKSVGGANLDCTTHSCETLFTTGDKYDATPPSTNMILPGDWAIVGDNQNTAISASYSDDSGVKQISFYFRNDKNVNSDLVDILVNPYEAEGTREWNLWKPRLQDPEKAEIGGVFARTFDLDNHQTDSATQQVKIVPAYCFNGTLDSDKGEQQVGNPPGIAPDCGKDSQCGACTGEFCDSNFDCAGTYCDISQHKCVARPKILNVSPLEAGVGSLVTVQGSNFGTSPGSVLFNGVSAPIVACSLTGNSPSWYNNAVIVKVPGGSVNGYVELRKPGYSGINDLANFDNTTSGDTWGFQGNFTLTSEVLPGLSCVSPREESPFNTIDIAGENLGASKGSIKFSDLLVTGGDITNWQSDGKKITVTVPRMPAQTLSLGALTSDNKSSNFLPFVVKPVSETILPTIDYIDPEKGPVGTYVTIAGRNFGETGSVVFKLNPTDTTGIAADLPPALCDNFWNPTQIIVKVPNAIVLGDDTLRDYYIQVKTTVGESNTKKFTVNKDPISPGLCKISPSSGPAAVTEVTFSGERFGAVENRGMVEYWQSVTSTFISLISPKNWSNTEIKDEVPANAKTGGVKVWSMENSLYSNALSFKVQNCKDELKKGKTLSEVCVGVGEKCCGDGTCNTTCPEDAGVRSSMFAWSFTSGQFPVVPKVLERCGNFCVGTTKACASNQDCSGLPDPSNLCQPELPSPAPSTKWPNSNAVCVNAQVDVLFNTAISNNGSILSTNPQETFFVYKCLDEACALSDVSQVLPGDYNYNTTLNDRIFFTPTTPLATSTVYQGVVTTNVRSMSGILSANMSEDSGCLDISSVFPGKKASYCFKFKTSPTDALCKIGQVVVSPVNYATSTLNITLNNFYDATPLAEGNACIGLDGSDYDWRWNPSDETTKDNLTSSQYSSVTNKDANADGRVDALDQNLGIKIKETITPEVISATWNDDPEHANFSQKIKGLAYLNLLPRRPKITEYYPNCNSACTNAAVGFKFDIPVKNPSYFYLLKCSNAFCTSGNYVYPWINYQYLEPQNVSGQSLAKGMIFNPVLEKNSLYKAIIYSYSYNGVLYGVRSLGDALLDPQYINYYTYGFTWTFRTKDDNVACSVASVEMNPASSTVNVIGETAQYFSIPKGTPDSCSPNGQVLQGNAYNWDWSSVNTNVATISELDRGQRPLGSVTSTIYCGDNQINGDETCDNSGSTCNINCDNVTAGTQACTDTNKVQCCGNGGAPEFNEECDLGVLNGAPGSNCTFNCLRKNTVSLNYCLLKNTSVPTTNDARKADCQGRWGAISICGNSAVEDGEECDLGASNGAVGGTCSEKCLIKARNFGTSGSNVCGNKIVEPTPVSQPAQGNNEECDGQIGCAADCRWDFKGDDKIDPNQYAKAIGLGVVNPTTKQQTTQIKASTAGKTGSADFILQCGFNPVDSSCPGSDPDKGAGVDSCCYLRPQVMLDNIPGGTWPRPPYSSGICPNAKLSVRFDQIMDENSFTSSTEKGYYNIILAEATSTPNCPAGTYRVGYKELQPKNWWQKIKFVVRSLLGRPALADYYCAGGIEYELQTVTDTQTIGGASASSTVVSLVLKEPLENLKNYRLVAGKDAASIYGVKMQNKWEMDFTTADQLCKINQLSIDPEAYAFSRTGEEKNFIARPTFINPAVISAPAQELQSMPTVYDWTYYWIDGDDLVDIISVTPDPANLQQATTTALSKNGDTTASANVMITVDQSANSTVGQVFNATSTISVFICNNPWPSLVPAVHLGLGYFDASANNNGVAVGQGWSNFKLIYCRDSGVVYTPDGQLKTDDDLAALSLNSPLYHQGDNSGIFKEFFFTFNSPTNKNSIGLRVYSNTNHLSIADWYKFQPWIPKGSPVPVKVGSDDHIYEALQEGRTYYINGLNTTSDNKVYTNVYVFAFSDNPTSETLNVVTQLLNNFTLNVNEVGNKARIAALMRDFTRFKDLKLMGEKLATSYGSKGFFPKLTESAQYGTYLPAYTNSKWQSWQLLSNSLAFGMPNDPINQFYGCGSSTLSAPHVDNLGPFDPVTCWNAASSTFICPNGSHVYQYETKGGVEARVLADLEEGDGTNWNVPLKNILDVKLCSVTRNVCKTDAECPAGENCSVVGVNFQLAGSCISSVKGIGGLCGDGIVGPGEECEIRQVKYDDCIVNGYAGKELFGCQDDCTWSTTGGGCIPQGKCGDGIIQENEDCDDGVNNGKYGYCNISCTGKWGTAGYCGDRKVNEQEEICDSSALRYNSSSGSWYYSKSCSNNPLKSCSSNSDCASPGQCIPQFGSGSIIGWCSLNNTISCTNNNQCSPDKGICVTSGGSKYNRDKIQSCSWDCQSYDYCGDGKVNPSYETCESSESCQVGVCSATSGANANKYCESNEDCFKGVACERTQICTLTNPVTGQCINYVYSPQRFCTNTGQICSNLSDCTVGYSCDNYVAGKKYCFVPNQEYKYTSEVVNGKVVYKDTTQKYTITGNNGAGQNFKIAGCNWDLPSAFANNAVSGVSCLPAKAIETPISQLNCGIDADKDGNYKDAGEDCDFGPANGNLPPTPAYNQTATYCTLGCKQATISGGFCGNNTLEALEICETSKVTSTYSGRFCISPDYTQKTAPNFNPSPSGTPCDMSSCTAFVCPEGWKLCQSASECPTVNISLSDFGGSQDDIFQAEIDGQLYPKYIIPAISGGNTSVYPANSSLNLLSMPKGTHKIKVYNITGGQSGTGRITFDPLHVEMGQQPFEAYSTQNYQDKWHNVNMSNPKVVNKDIAPTNQDKKGSNYVDFVITLPKECGSYWTNWLKIFEPDPVKAAKFNEEYPCVADGSDPGSITYQFIVK